MIDKDINTKKINLKGYIRVPESFTEDDFFDKFADFIQVNRWAFVGDIKKTSEKKSIPNPKHNNYLSDVLEEVKEVIVLELTEVSYNTWIKPLEPYSIDGSKVIILVPNDFYKEIINSRYLKLLKTSFLYVTDKEFDIKVITEDDIS